MSKPRLRILLIDDDVNLSKVLSYQLQQQGFQVDAAANGSEGLEKFLAHEYDIVISDIQMPDVSGIDVLRAVRRQNEDVVVIMITAYGSVENAIEACHIGADDYITKPFGKEQLQFVIEKALRLRQLQQENKHLRTELSTKFKFENMIAHSAPMQAVLKTTQRIANSNASVLILGDSGTGKELIARAIHYNSPRKEKPLITVNCPSIPDNLLESELFGHVKGAFTGALRDRKGRFEEADGGTVFLDEIADLRLDLQAKLLRVLQEMEFSPVGSSQIIKVDVRIIAATNQDLRQLVEEKKFREDLYYRLNVIPLILPPLRQRKEDIPYLVDFFMKRFASGRSLKLAPAALKALQNYSWPGNVRELENMIERLVTLAPGEIIELDELPDYIVNGSLPVTDDFNAQGADLSLEEIERNAIMQALQRAAGNQSEAARLLNIPRHVLLYRMKKFGL